MSQQLRTIGCSSYKRPRFSSQHSCGSGSIPTLAPVPGDPLCTGTGPMYGGYISMQAKHHIWKKNLNLFLKKLYRHV